MSRRSNSYNSRQQNEPGKIPSLNAFEEALLAAAEKQVDIRIDGMTRKASVYEALVMKILQSAMNGSPHAQRNASALITAANDKRAAKNEDDIAFWRDYRNRKWAEIAAAKAAGKPEPKFLPHPDDLEFDDIKGVTCKGPINDEQDRRYQDRVDLIIACLRQNELEDRLDRINFDSKEDAPVSTAGVMAYENNMHLPKRMQLNELQIFSLQRSFRRLTTRQLLADCHRDWKRLGWKMKRGARMMPLAQYKAVHDWTVAFVERVTAAGDDQKQTERAVLDMFPSLKEIREVPLETWKEASKDWRKLMGLAA